MNEPTNKQLGHLEKQGLQRHIDKLKPSPKQPTISQQTRQLSEAITKAMQRKN